jgi:hypothetical protein
MWRRIFHRMSWLEVHAALVRFEDGLRFALSHDTVTRSDAVTGNEQQEFTQSDLQECVAEEQADSLRLLVEVGGYGAFVAAFGNRAEIVLAHLNRQSPKSAARPFPVGLSFDRPTSPWRSLSLRREDSATNFPSRQVRGRGCVIGLENDLRLASLAHGPPEGAPEIAKAVKTLATIARPESSNLKAMLTEACPIVA